MEKRKKYIAVVLFSGLLFSGAIFYLFGKAEQRNVAQRFEDAAENVMTLVENKINEELFSFKRSTAFFSDFDNIEEVDYPKFLDFAQQALNVQPVLLALEWAPRILHDDRVRFEENARHHSPSFSIVFKKDDGSSVPVVSQSEYYPIYFIEPLKGYEAALGFDMASDEERMKIMQKAADENRPIISAPVDIVYEKDRQQGFLAYIAIYKQGRVFGTPRDRREVTQGFLLGIFRTADLIYNIKEIKEYHLELAIIDVTQQDTPKQLYSSIKTPSSPDSEIRSLTDVRTIGSRSWQLTCAAEEGYYIVRYSGRAYMVLSIGILLTLAYASYLWVEFRKRKAVIEELRVHKGEFEKLQKETKKVILAGNAFFDTISYKMRIPLTSIIGNAEILLASTLADEYKEEVTSIMRSAESLLGVANDVLDIANIETEHVELVTEYFNLEDAIKNVLSTVALTSRKKKVSYNYHYAMHIPRTVLGDESRVCQILSSIVKNAEFFTEKGKIEVTVLAEQVDDHYNYSIAVSDTGIGISQGEISKVFDRFFHGENVKESNERGVGLGLHLCQKLAQAMGGGVTVTSKEGEGSTFTLTLPFKASEAGEGVPSLDEEGEKLELPVIPVKMDGILVVDDSIFNCKIVAKMLRKIVSCDVVECESGTRALELIKEHHFDVIFLDCQMPGIDGYQTSQSIRSYESSANAKPATIVALTGHVLKGEREKCVLSGMNDYLVKPVRLATLWQVLKKWVV